MKPLHLLLQRLADANLEFVVVGGFAGVMHGAGDTTEDIDICAALTPENVEKLRATLADLHPVHRITHKRLSFLEYPPAGQQVANLYLATDAGVLDVLSNIAGVGDYARLKEQAVEISLFGRRCRVISIDDLIKAKEAIGRDKDLVAVKKLRAVAATRHRQNS